MSKFETIITPDKYPANYLKDLWQYRDLFYFLAWRDIAVRYKQTVLGIAWCLIRPLSTMIIFTIVFGNIAGLPSGDSPYAVMVFTAMLPWQFFSNIFTKSSNSLVSNVSLVSKVYFPRLIIPTTTVIIGLVDFAVSFCMLIVLMLIYGITPGWKIIFLPFFLSIAMLISLGAGFFISAMNVKFRDFMHIVPFILQFGLHISPVGYSSSIIPDNWRLLYSINPMVGVIDGFRWVLLGDNIDIYWPGLVISILLAVIIFVSGLKFFMANERYFADTI